MDYSTLALVYSWMWREELEKEMLCGKPFTEIASETCQKVFSKSINASTFVLIIALVHLRRTWSYGPDLWNWYVSLPSKELAIPSI